MSTPNSDAWAGLAVPAEKSSITVRRVDADGKWDLFWGVDCEKHVLLVLKHEISNMPRNRLPKLREIEVRSEVLPNGDTVIVWRLLSRAAKDLFHRLCIDIIESTARCSVELEAVETAVARTWRWHHLLKGGTSGLLSARAQVGLIGELLVLESYLIPVLGADLAVNAWLGPLDAPQDFAIGNTAVESKAISSDNPDSIRISSAYQLQTDDLGALFLHISHVDAADPGDSDALYLNEHVNRVRERLADAESSVRDRFNALLVAAGYSDDDDYSPFRWNSSEKSLYRVDDEFPRLTPSSIPSAVSSLTYTLDLRTAGSSLVSPQNLRDTLSESLR